MNAEHPITWTSLVLSFFTALALAVGTAWVQDAQRQAERELRMAKAIMATPEAQALAAGKIRVPTPG
jgi:hypothetical protein